MGFSVSTLTTFKLEDSGILIQKAVLGADLLQYVDVRPGYPEATVAVNVLGMTAGFADAACGWTSAGSTNFTQISITNAAKSWKQSLCLDDLRSYWLSTQLQASAFGETLPFEQVIADQMIKETKKYAETLLGTQMIAALTVANGSAAGPTGSWSSSNAYDKAVATLDALPASALSQEDLVMFMSYANFRYLQTAIIAKNLYNFVPSTTDGSGLGQYIIIPGTNVKAVPVAGFGTSPKVYCGPSKHIVVVCGLVDDTDKIEAWWSQDNQEMRLISKFSMGLGALAESFVYTAGA